MQIISKSIEITSEKVFTEQLAPLEEALYLDIETTGLSAESNRVELIGCLYHGGDSWKMTQWYDETGLQEKDILESFLVFAKHYTACIHYNGDRFDLPFLKKRMEILGLSGFPEMRSFDIYQMIRPYKKFIALDSFSQPSVEAVFDTGRDASADEEGASVLTRNEANLKGLVLLTGASYLDKLFNGPLTVTRAHANHYRKMDGSRSQELVLHACASDVPDKLISKSLVASSDGCYATVIGNQITIKLPLYIGELKYFYANHNDYYYLPAEDMAIHKSIASFVDRSHREQAKAHNCYTRKSGKYLPEWTLFRTPFFKKDYKDKYAWFELTEELKKDKEFFSDYAVYVFRHIINS